MSRGQAIPPCVRARWTALLLVPALVAGCAQVDPFTRDGMWQPEGINERNLAVSVVNPGDLLRGHGETRPQPRMATDAVRRLLAGVPTPLPTISADAAPGSGGSATAAPALPAATGGSAPSPAATGID